MKKIGIIIVVGLLVAAGAAYLWMDRTQAKEQMPIESGVELYTCGMHPEIISSEPGNCPICGMKLTPKRSVEDRPGTIRVDATTRQNMGLVTTPVTLQSLSKSVRAFGRVAVPDPNYYSVTLKVSGWIEELFVKEQGERVFKGQPLLTIYSPELVTAQREYLAVRNNSDGSEKMSDLLAVAENRLLNWDVPRDQLERLKESGEVSRTMLLRAPADGFVISKNINTGDRVMPGRVLYEIADLSTVWVSAYVYEKDMPYLSVGQQATVTTQNSPGQRYDSRVVYVSPTLNPKGQVEIRLQLENTDLALRPEMYAEVTLEKRQRGRQLSVPRTAVINSGARQIAYVAVTDDTFEPRTVTTGAVGENDMVEVMSGLAADERVVVSGQFMLDSESRLSESIGPMAGHQHHGGTMEEEPMDEPMDQPIDQAMDAPMTDQHQHDSGMLAATAEDAYDIHTCPMPEHYHVLNYGPGQCDECGMALVPVGETDNDNIYVCPMPQCGTVQHGPGQCPVCNMNLIKYEPEAKHAQ